MGPSGCQCPGRQRVRPHADTGGKLTERGRRGYCRQGSSVSCGAPTLSHRIAFIRAWISPSSTLWLTFDSECFVWRIHLFAYCDLIWPSSKFKVVTYWMYDLLVKSVFGGNKFVCLNWITFKTYILQKFQLSVLWLMMMNSLCYLLIKFIDM